MTRNKRLDPRKDEPQRFPRVKVSFISAVVVVALEVITAIIGFLGRSTFTPRIIDQLFGISKYVLDETSKRIEAGYCANMTFLPKQPADRDELLFYAQDDKSVRVSLLATSRGSSVSTIDVYVDGVLWLQNQDVPYTIVHGAITKRLRFDVQPGGDLHVVRIVPHTMASDSEIFVDCVVLVSDQIGGSK